MAKQATVTNVDNGDDVDASWGDLVKADIEALFDDKEVYEESDAATVTFDQDNGAIQMVELGGDRTLALSNQKLFKPLALIIKQDGTGGRTPTFFTTIKWAYGITPSVSQGANRYDIFMIIPVAYSAPNWTYLGIIVSQDHQ